jgi:diaminopimelate epimerase
MGGRTFYKMTGSGNDFVFFDARDEAPGELETPALIARLCARGTGIGADGVVFLVRSDRADIGIRYYNSDGSTASLCGNATLCTANLAVQIGAVDPNGFRIDTDAGIVQARIVDGLPEFDLPEAAQLTPELAAIPLAAAGERRIGYVTAGIPHVVILVDDIDGVDVVGRGRPIRYDAAFPEGTNVNFVGRGADGGWRIRTYERGVEGETLACGTGTAATAILLRSWGEALADQVVLRTQSGSLLHVNLCRDTGAWLPSLRGEGRLVFRGELGSI